MVRKTVTVLFADVAGSTELGERIDPEALRRIMTGYFAVSREALERHGATVEKFIGDAVMAVFGIPAAHEDDALRAARAAVDLRREVSTLGIALRIGVNTGEVVAEKGETLVTGDAVNVAARLEQRQADDRYAPRLTRERSFVMRTGVRFMGVLPVALSVAVIVVTPGSAREATSRGDSAQSHVVAQTAVRFSFHGTKEVGRGTLNRRGFSASGSGSFVLASPPVQGTPLDAARITAGPLTVKQTAATKAWTYELEVTRATYAFSPGKRAGEIEQAVLLAFRIEQSTRSACPVGTIGTVTLTSGERTAIDFEAGRCAIELIGHALGTASVSIVPSPRPALLPSRLELTVNGETCTATVGKACYRPGDGGDSLSVASLTPLTIEAVADLPMPPGWRLEVHRTADPLSSSGNYYTVCKTETEDSCDAVRPGLNSRNGLITDRVYAQVIAPTYVAIYDQIEVDYQQP